MADLVSVAQSGVDPTTGSYLSSERRKALFRFGRSRISSNKVFGGGGAIVPIRSGPDPESLSIVKTETSAITSLQKQVNDLTIRNNQLLANFASVGSLQKQIDILRVSVIDLGGKLQEIGGLITTDTKLEQQETAQEQERDKKIVQRSLREGKESALEKAIQSALMAPVQAIAQRAQSILGSLMQFFGTLFVGWLTDKGIETLRAFTEGNTNKLEDIKNNVIKNLGIVGGIFLVMHLGIFKVLGSITRLGVLLGKFVLKNTIGRLFAGMAALGSAAVNAGKKLFGLAPEANAAAKASTVVAEGAEGAARAGANVADDAAKVGLKKGAGLASKLLPGIATVVNLGVSGYRYSQGDIVGGSLSAISAIPIIGWGAVGVDIAREFGAFEGTPLGKNQKPRSTTPKPQTPSAAKPSPTKAQTAVIPPTTAAMAPKPIATPETPIVPQQTSINFIADTSNQLNAFQNGNYLPTQEEFDTSMKPSYGEISLPVSDQQTTTSFSSQTPSISPIPAQVQKFDTVRFNIGPEPEPKPNIIYTRTSSAQQNPAQGQPLKQGEASEVPLISSSNHDNFYILYSQVNYNVVM